MKVFESVRVILFIKGPLMEVHRWRAWSTMNNARPVTDTCHIPLDRSSKRVREEKLSLGLTQRRGWEKVNDLLLFFPRFKCSTSPWLLYWLVSWADFQEPEREVYPARSRRSFPTTLGPTTIEHDTKVNLQAVPVLWYYGKYGRNARMRSIRSFKVYLTMDFLVCFFTQSLHYTRYIASAKTAIFFIRREREREERERERESEWERERERERERGRERGESKS